MPHIESSFNINAASRAGAKGMWQFMWGTARYFMKINRIMDQRFDPLYSTEAAARLLKR
ncbi:MAG: transglycosylase SLT domain-containing protein, partial [Aliifodinibius sp.]|nr:lytic transglycosylase domain-containing protein [Fodinibius sp.]NIV14730.1 transglycosylase SLT domain-containing protein [Fodinibius sp.]NIY28625.1 transglycosylase SLT domain-containing protein [Fodinibius sp.]